MAEDARAPLTVKVAVSAAAYYLDKPYSYLLPEKLRSQAKAGMRVIVPFGNGNRRCEGIILEVEEAQPSRPLKAIDSILDRESVLDEEGLKLALWMRNRFFCTVYEAVRAMLPAGLWYAVESVYTLSDGYDKEKAYDKAGKSKQEQLILDAVFAHGGVCPLEDLQRLFQEGDPNRALNSLVKKGVLLTDSREKRRVGDKSQGALTLTISPEEALELAGQKRKRAPQQAAALELLSALGSVSVSELRYFTGCTSATVKSLIKNGYAVEEHREVFRRPRYETEERMPLPDLNAQQQKAYDELSALADKGEPAAALLYGVTGSGKTSVYVRLIDEQLRKGRASILMVPEISLTPQMLRTFSRYFGDKIAVLHSSLSLGERYDEWKRVRQGLAKVIIGTRSAVFAPCEDLGLIIIDEEQEYTYKSENTPRYHARDVARYRCGRNRALLLLGSATPDVGSMYAARNGSAKLITLPERYNQRPLPEVRVVDMRKELKRGNATAVSLELETALRENMERGEQSILFLNRRGTSYLISCGECGYTYRCPNCSVSLTWHSDRRRLICHYCGHSERVGEACPECGGKLNFSGIGTQKLEEQLRELFPDIEILRMDADSVSPMGSHEAILSRFRNENIPILIGTQMVTKGLDFPNVTLVGVISADQSLYAGSYRSAERCFSLITQVVGRSGRGEKPGKALIQSFTPGNQVIRQAARQDYDGFYASEIELRRVQYSPPFSDTLIITATGETEDDVLACATYIRDVCKAELWGRKDAEVLGPAPMSVVRVNRRYRYRVTLACECDKFIRELVSSLLIHCNTAKEYKGVSVYADMNPME